MSAAALLAKLRSLQGRERMDELDRIEKEHGRGFRKSLQDQIVSLDRAVTERSAVNRKRSIKNKA